MHSDCGYLGQQGVSLDVAMGAEAGGNAVEVAVVVAGVTDQFERAFRRQSVQDFVESFPIEVTGCGDADGAVGGENFPTANLRLPFEFGFERAEKFDLEAAHAVAVAESQAPGLFEGVADSGDGEAFGKLQQRPADSGEEVRVFVAVEVSNVDASALEFLNLGEGFPLDVVRVDSAAKESLEEVGE
jgi:hypothetical protein